MKLEQASVICDETWSNTSYVMGPSLHVLPEKFGSISKVNDQSEHSK